MNLFTSLAETKIVADLIKEKNNEIQILNKKLKMSATQYQDSPDLIALQEEKDKVYKEMLVFKEQVIELKENVAALENEKVEWMDSKVSFAQQSKEHTIEDISRTISNLSIKYEKVKTLK